MASITAGTKLGGVKKGPGLKMHSDMKDVHGGKKHGGKQFGKAKRAARKAV